jgi:hypothetical protein
MTTTFPEWPLLRQTPRSRGIWQDCEFIVDQPVEECDFWVIYEGLYAPEITRCAPERIIFFAGEPPGIRRYPNKFLQQFGLVITSHLDTIHPCVRQYHQAQPWHAGVDRQTGLVTKTYDDLHNIKSFAKTKVLSVVCSSKATNEGHRRRLHFLKILKAHFGSEIDVYGRGFNEIPDKWDAIFPYKYHLAMENSRVPNYFTEKLTDAYLGGAYPLYYGCVNIGDYFPNGSFTELDIRDPKKALKVIDRTISNNNYERNQEQLQFARELVLDKHNLFPLITNLVHEYGTPSRCGKIQLLPEVAFIPLATYLYRALSPRNWLRRFSTK